MSDTPVLLDTFRGQAHPWLCDVMGHLNTRHLVAMFDDAMAHFLSSLMGNSSSIVSDGFGWADVQIKLEMLREVKAGVLVRIRTGVLKLGTTSLTTVSQMSDPSGETVYARVETVTVSFDLARRRAAPIRGDIRRAAEEHMVSPNA